MQFDQGNTCKHGCIYVVGNTCKTWLHRLGLHDICTRVVFWATYRGTWLMGQRQLMANLDMSSDGMGSVEPMTVVFAFFTVNYPFP